MKIKQIAFASLAMLIVTACGKKQVMPEALSPETSTIDGNMGEYFEVVDGTYALSEYSGDFTFDVKCIKNPPEVTITKLGIGYEIYDEDGNVIDRKNATLEDLNPWMSYEFLNLREGEMGKVNVGLPGWPDKLKGGKTFKVEINAREKEGEDVASDNSVSPVAEASNNWNSVLDEYERYCTKLASMSKKARAGDISVMTEYSSVLEQAQSLSDKLENAQGEMTPAQVARLNKIAAKMAQSAM